MSKTFLDVTKQYQKELDLVRENPDLLANYCFEENAENTIILKDSD